MKSQLKEIRERLQDAVDIKDWWVVKSQMNKLDTILFNLEKQEQGIVRCKNCNSFIFDNEGNCEGCGQSCNCV